MQDMYRPSPPVWPWFIAYCIFMALVYLAVLAFGAFLLAKGAGASSGEDRLEGITLGSIYAFLGFFLAALFGIAPWLPRRPGVWVYDLVLICVGLTSVCCLPATIPLLLFWIKPEAKAFFGRA